MERSDRWQVVTYYLDDSGEPPVVRGNYETEELATRAADEERGRLLRCYGRDAGMTDTRVVPPRRPA